MNIETEIKEAITKHLPSQVGDVLRTRLDQAERDAKATESLRKERDELSQRLSAHAAITERERLISDKERNLAKREAEVFSREQDAKLNLCMVNSAERRVADLKEIVSLVFQNNRFKYQEFHSEQVPVTNNGYMSTVSKTSSKDVQGEQ